MWFVTNKALGKPLLNFSYLPVLNEQDDSSIEFIFTIIIMGEQEDSDDLLTVNVSEAAATKLELITLITAKFIHISEENLEVVGTP